MYYIRCIYAIYIYIHIMYYIIYIYYTVIRLYYTVLYYLLYIVSISVVLLSCHGAASAVLHSLCEQFHAVP